MAKVMHLGVAAQRASPPAAKDGLVMLGAVKACVAAIAFSVMLWATHAYADEGILDRICGEWIINIYNNADFPAPQRYQAMLLVMEICKGGHVDLNEIQIITQIPIEPLPQPTAKR